MRPIHVLVATLAVAGCGAAVEVHADTVPRPATTVVTTQHVPEAAVVDETPVRGTQVPVEATFAAPASTQPPIPQAIPGDCDSYIPIFRYFGASDYEVNYFVPRIIKRESGCGLDLLNDRGGDTGHVRCIQYTTSPATSAGPTTPTVGCRHCMACARARASTRSSGSTPA